MVKPPEKNFLHLVFAQLRDSLAEELPSHEQVAWRAAVNQGIAQSDSEKIAHAWLGLGLYLFEEPEYGLIQIGQVFFQAIPSNRAAAACIDTFAALFENRCADNSYWQAARAAAELTLGLIPIEDPANDALSAALGLCRSWIDCQEFLHVGARLSLQKAVNQTVDAVKNAARVLAMADMTGALFVDWHSEGRSLEQADEHRKQQLLEQPDEVLPVREAAELNISSRFDERSKESLHAFGDQCRKRIYRRLSEIMLELLRS